MARIGIVSDSHGRAERTQRAVAMLVGKGVDVLIHLGDIGDEAVIDAMIGRLSPSGAVEPPVHLVFGNTDDDRGALGRYAEALGIEVGDPMGRLVLDGKAVAFTHGDRAELVAEAMSGEPAYFLHGHTHRQRDERVGPTRVINPGALHRASRFTAAVLDVSADRLEFVEVPM